VELGRYEEAAAAARRADDVQPGLPSFARLSYLAELRGELTAASRLMGRALEAAGQRPSDIAFARLHLGDLARQSGDLDAAGKHYDAALAAVPSSVPGMVGRARVALARGDSAAALSLLEEAARRMPLPEHLLLLGETYESLGNQKEAAAQYAVVRATVALAGRQGVANDLETALFEADHGDPAVALAAARREWTRRHSVHAADALAWALHANGRDREALGYSRSATRLGTRDSGFLLHRGMIQRSLGLRDAARRDLTAALRVDAGFSPLQLSRARQALATLGARR
jgi:tetratricopeptide (TPR) repeat protein